MQTEDVADVALLGEITRRCIPNYVKGAYDTASTSAHTHIVGFTHTLEEEHIEALMVGLMPFLSLGWMRPKYAKYTFRDNVTGTTSGVTRYSRFATVALDPGISNYKSRYTWLKDQNSKHRVPSVEIRSNENSGLWVYLINPILTNQSTIDTLRDMINTTQFKGILDTVRGNRGNLAIFHNFIEMIKEFIVPVLLAELPNILLGLPEDQREFTQEILTAYLKEDVKKYDTLINSIIKADDEVTYMFKVLDTEVAKGKSKFNVIKEVK